MTSRARYAVILGLVVVALLVAGWIWYEARGPDPFDYGPHHAELASLHVFNDLPVGGELVEASDEYLCTDPGSGASAAPRRTWRITSGRSLDDVVADFSDRSWNEGLGVFRLDHPGLLFIVPRDHADEGLQKGITVAVNPEDDSEIWAVTHVNWDDFRPCVKTS